MKRLLPCLLVVSVILVMGVVAIVQGLRGSPTADEDLLDSAERAPTAEPEEAANVLVPVTAIGALDAEPPANRTEISRFADASEKNAFREATLNALGDAPTGVFNDTGSRFSSLPSTSANEGSSVVAQIARGQDSGSPPPLVEDPVDQSPSASLSPSSALPSPVYAEPSPPTPYLPEDTLSEQVKPAEAYADMLQEDSVRMNRLRSADSGAPATVSVAVPSTATPLAGQDVPVTPTSVAADVTQDPVVTSRDTAAAPQEFTIISDAARANTLFPEEHDTDPVRGGYQDEQTPSVATTTIGKPGARTLEGLQSPNISVEKTAPAEIQIGKPTEFHLTVRNVGKVTASQVLVEDQIPEGTWLVAAVPDATATENGVLYWELGALDPGEEETVTMQLMPEVEGDIGSVATVTFQASASVRTVATRPLLTIEHTVPDRVHVGEGVTLNIRVSNPGSGAAQSVVLEEDVPDGLSHPAGAALERALGTIKPGETKEVELTLTAEKPGIIENTVVARADANLAAEDRVQFEVIAPSLQVVLAGPKKRYLERRATHTLSVENLGTAPATNIELAAHLPKGMKFVETNNAGQYDPRTHAVYWNLEELPAKQKGNVQLTTLPVETGEQKLRFESHADLGLKDTLEQVVVVDGIASLFFEVADTADPIEVGSETTYEIRLVNEGSKSSTGISIEAVLPPGMRPFDGDGPTRFEVVGQRVVFEPLARLAPGADAYYKVHVRGLEGGDQRIRVQVQSNEMQLAVSEEESTRVYEDN